MISFSSHADLSRNRTASASSAMSGVGSPSGRRRVRSRVLSEAPHMVTNKALLLERESRACASVVSCPKAVAVHATSASEMAASGVNVLSIPPPERFLKVMKRRFRQPPSYLRKDHPKTEWLVKPNQQDFDLNADEILEMLVNNQIPKVKVGRPSGRGSRRRKGGVRKSKARKIKSTLASAAASGPVFATKSKKKSKKKKTHRKKNGKSRHPKDINKDERNRLAAEKNALSEVFAAAEMGAVAERAAALAAPVVTLKNKVWTSLNAAREFNLEGQSTFVERMTASPASRAGETKLHKMLLKDNYDLLRGISTFEATAKKVKEPLPGHSTTGMNSISATNELPPPEHGSENSGFVSMKSMQAKRDRQRLREKLRSARRDEAKAWMFTHVSSSPSSNNRHTVSTVGNRVGSGRDHMGPATDDDDEEEDSKQRQMAPLNFVKMNIARINAPGTTEHTVTARTVGKQERREETYARAMKIREDERTDAKRKALSREHRPLLLARLEETHQRSLAWLKICTIGSRWQKFADLYYKAQENQINSRLEKSAASVIIRGWNRKTAKKRGMEFRGAYVTVQRACLTLIMRRRATVQKRSTERIMSFMCNIAVQRFRAVMLKYRSCVVKVQRYYRAFRQCKHARILALNYIWDEVEAELRIIGKRNRQRRLSKMLNKLSQSSPWLNAGVRRQRVIKRRRQVNKVNHNASADVTGIVLDGDTVDGVQFVVGDRKAALLDYHLRDGLKQIMKNNEVKASTVESVPFDIRFEVLFVLLTELRKKHALEIARIQQINETARLQVTRDEIMTLVSSPDSSSSLKRARIKAMEEERDWQKKLHDRKRVTKSQKQRMPSQKIAERNTAGIGTENKATMSRTAGDALEAKPGQTMGVLPDDSEVSPSILPYPDFIVYSTLNETSLLTIVNAGRKLFEKRKKEGYMTTFKNIKPLYLPYGSENRLDADTPGDEIWHQLREEAEDKKRSNAARNRRKSNTGFKIQTMAARNEIMKKMMHEQSKQGKAERAKNKNIREGITGVIVSVPYTFRSKAAKSKFVY